MSYINQRLKYLLYKITRGRAYSWHNPVDSNVLQVPGMLTYREKQYLQCYCKKEYTGWGEIVDLGCWLGSSTAPMAAGLTQNGHAEAKDKKIHAYDLFRWEKWMEPFLKDYKGEQRPAEGESFEPLYRDLMSPWNDRIEVYPGDLNTMEWKGSPIEFLFVDAMKDWNLTNSIVKNFFPALEPGKSIIVLQDYAHFYTSWIHLLAFRLEHYLVPVFHVPGSPSMVFLYERQIPTELLEKTLGFENFSDAEINAAFRHSSASINRKMRGRIAAAYAMTYYHTGQKEKAVNAINVCRSYPVDDEVREAGRLIDTM